jgi:hypothetical protein
MSGRRKKRATTNGIFAQKIRNLTLCKNGNFHTIFAPEI